ncbi:hypothetical protein ANN_06818 [Periplaneta americana]|uniref:Uncharacterized protein n=1 Tax=Periplaneta americana TaxID=6978 RepID=A0ABQ8TF79_PERAM|nr:hypothetical protein ANN_06818 [Periplaneta americana]
MASVSDVSDFCASKSEFVPSEDSLSDSDNEVQTKKRKHNPMKWASNARKANRNKGMAYITKAGKSVPARSTGPPCKCSKQCFNKVHADMKMELLVSFNKLGDKEKQDVYLCGLLTVCNIARRCPKSGTGVPQEHTYLYKARDGTTELLVCKTAFCSLHGIDKSRVERLAKHLAQNVTSPSNLRGKHGNRPHAVSENCIAQVDQHIRSFPRRKSHYSRTDNVKKYYLAADLNVKKMYHFYLQKHEPQEYLKLQSGLVIKPNISYDFYYRYFVSNFNMSFGKPRTDTCETCDQVDKNIMSTECEEEKGKLRTEKELHLRKAQVFYTLLKEKSKLTKENVYAETICIDYQQNLELPKVPSSDVFYSRQL